MMRTHTAGELRAGDIGTDVVVCGWVDARRDHGGVVFLDVRDYTGLIQVVVDPSTPAGAEAHRLRAEYVVQVSGTVRARPEGTTNPDLDTGEIEIGADALTVLNESEPLPFPLDTADSVDEIVRLRHRYLDLRRPRLQRARATSSSRPVCRRARSTRCRRARSCSSSCSWSAGSTATSRSPAASATRTCGPIASSSSCSSTRR
jgi:aspartyl-tRNA synthetase